MKNNKLPMADLRQAYDCSYYFIAGCGGDLEEWVEGYERLLREQKIGQPKAWYTTTGQQINEFAGDTDNPYPADLTCLLFPLDGLDIGSLAMFKLAMQDRWFEDVINNMMPREEDHADFSDAGFDDVIKSVRYTDEEN